MHLNATLHVIDGHVDCPASCTPETVGHCAHCKDLRSIEGGDTPTTVLCAPDVGARSMATVLDEMVRA